jgi:5-methylcytosine-specific restriction endonuclease McrA
MLASKNGSFYNQRAMPLKDPVKRKAYSAAQYLKNRKDVIDRVKAYTEQNHDAALYRMRAWYETNKEKVSAEARSKRAINPQKMRMVERSRRNADIEHARLLGRLQYQRDKEKAKARANAYREQNPDKRAASQQRRRALKAGSFADLVLRSSILSRDGPDCCFCGIETVQPIHKQYSSEDRHYDHIVPLKRGGRHVIDNIRILCSSCNATKHHRLDCELVSPIRKKKA